MWTEGDLNSQPLQCECSALPVELSAQKVSSGRIELPPEAPEAPILSFKLRRQKILMIL